MKQAAVKTWIAGVALLGAAACSRPAREVVRPAEPARRAVRTASVVRVDADANVAVPGTVVARERASIAGRVAAAVVELPLREGQKVAAGAIVARLDDRAFRAAVSAAESGVQAAEAEDARTRALLAKNAATAQEAEMTAARASAARAALEAARDQLSYALLRAPFSGTVTARRVDVGDVVPPGTPLVEIEGDAGLEVRATVDGRVAAQIRTGQRVAAQIDGHPAPVEAVIRSLSPAGDAATHRFDVRADLPAAAGVRSGVFARLLLPGTGREPRLLVPAGAVFRRGGLSGVFVIEEARARLRWVAVGDPAEGQMEVRAGLAEGEQVALEPEALADGAAITGAAS